MMIQENKKADKGNSMVIMNKNTYRAKIYDHLNDTKSYKYIRHQNPYN